MRNKVYIPKLPYIVFELVEIDTEAQRKKWDEYQSSFESGVATDKPKLTGKQIDTIYMAVMPESFRSRIRSRDAIVQTGKEVYVDQYPVSPERISISGTFGSVPRLIGGTFMDGYTRLQQFYEKVILQQQDEFLNDEALLAERIRKSKSFIVLNYYDFLFRRFGSIVRENFDMNINARTNTNLWNYSFDFVITGELVQTDEAYFAKDPVLSLLDSLFGNSAQKALDESVNYLLAQASPTLQAAGFLVDVLTLSVNVSKTVTEIVNNYSAGANALGEQVVEGITMYE